MIVSCPSCQAKYQYDEARFGEAVVKKLRCSKCSGVFEVTRPGTAEQTHDGHLPVAGRRAEETTKQFDVSGLKQEEIEAKLPELAPLPPNRRFSLAVILGANAGQIYGMTKPRMVLGRGAGVEIQLQDSEVSRRHAMIEIRNEQGFLTDLGSTNGTFVEGVRIERSPLASHQEFSLGTTTLMFIVTELHDSALG
ncbi:MAG: FHA domain-containing protein [Acidobacteria bacterium]|nr:FHA domain-containing protein [Acidobacteriota bacterium]